MQYPFRFILLFCSLLILQKSSAQTAQYDYPYIGRPYTTGVGFRTLGPLGVPGVTLRQFINDRNAIEAIAGLWTDAVSTTLLFQHRIPAFQTTYFRNEHLNWYLGAGAHTTFKRRQQPGSQADSRDFEDEDNFGFGIDAYFAVEYKISAIPLAVGVDIKPFVEINNSGSFYFFPDPGAYAKLVLSID